MIRLTIGAATLALALSAGTAQAQQACGHRGALDDA